MTHQDLKTIVDLENRITKHLKQLRIAASKQDLEAAKKEAELWKKASKEYEELVGQHLLAIPPQNAS